MVTLISVITKKVHFDQHSQCFSYDPDYIRLTEYFTSLLKLWVVVGQYSLHSDRHLVKVQSVLWKAKSTNLCPCINLSYVIVFKGN